jgi:hypothetical protein
MPRSLDAQMRYGFPTGKKAASQAMVDPAQVDVLIELAKALLAVANREPVVPIVNVPAPVVNVSPPNVTVQVPETNWPEIRPTIHVDAPRFDVHVPKQSAPVIRVEAPTVTVNNQMPDVQSIRVVATPAVEVRRDAAGRISGLDTE